MAVIPSVVFVALLLYILYLTKKRHDRARVPPGAQSLPGPKCYPILGRVHDIPSEASWLKFYEWSKQYGPIYQMEMFGSVHVWISSEQIAHDLLSRRAPIYSDRPQIPNLPDNRTKGDYLALSGRNETWKRQRKLCQQLMATSAHDSLHGYPTMERDRFLYLLSKDSSQYREYVEQFTARSVARLSWGSPHSAQVLRVTTHGLLETISPSGALPNVISCLRHLPACLSPWKRKENARHELEATMLKDNVQYVHERINEGNAPPSFVRTFIDGLSSSADKAKWGEEAEATYVVGQMAIAGALTIGSPIQSFLLAMLHYPDWQEKLHKEIDEVCEGACPQWADRSKLPMLRAVVKEVIRWRPPVPTGIPHALEQDDVYNGYFIPAGATIHALEWAITRDETTYPDAETFNPARWLKPEYPTYKEPLTLHPNLNGFSQFGFGRRTCQGVPIVEQDLFLAMGGMAWAFHITKKRRADGTEVPVHWNDFTPLLIAKPAPFKFDAIVRSEEKEFLLAQMWESGKGEDDEDEEQQQLRQTIWKDMEKRDKGALAAHEHDDDVSSDRGSETSGVTTDTDSTASTGSEGDA
ncbi:Uu.00g061940.m01.CDS01 [Anthostomella pinea]|uniref:Uu.00g061940.m01.CDS01 n=1 Tax=Anthostomella pinea TaxID=933095 RepID=A0AAI8YMM3_9PEZI|nr:Uu.00g061940.m01.CDS01 [Anthostomella pinea]